MFSIDAVLYSRPASEFFRFRNEHRHLGVVVRKPDHPAAPGAPGRGKRVSDVVPLQPARRRRRWGGGGQRLQHLDATRNAAHDNDGTQVPRSRPSLFRDGTLTDQTLRTVLRGSVFRGSASWAPLGVAGRSGSACVAGRVRSEVGRTANVRVFSRSDSSLPKRPHVREFAVECPQCRRVAEQPGVVVHR